jgi:hypothetical protein
MSDHKHKYEEIGIAKITRITNKNYFGTAGDKAFLMRVCTCGDMQAFDYGRTKEMEELKEVLKKP